MGPGFRPRRQGCWEIRFLRHQRDAGSGATDRCVHAGATRQLGKGFSDEYAGGEAVSRQDHGEIRPDAGRYGPAAKSEGDRLLHALMQTIAEKPLVNGPKTTPLSTIWRRY